MGAWIDQVNALGCLVVGMAIGLELRSRNSLSPCPACGAEVRGKKAHDRRGPIGTGDGAGWCCWSCSRKGGPVDLVSLKAFGAQLGAGDGRWKQLREYCEELGLLGTKPSVAIAAPTRIVRQFPPPWEVDAVWRSSISADLDSGVAWWLRSRKLAPSTIADLDLVRALRLPRPIPDWIYRGRRTWLELAPRYAAIVPLYDVSGEMVSIHARAVKSGNWSTQDKATSPRDYSTAGLVMANDCAREVLAGEHAAGKIAIAEGVPDFLTLTTSVSPMCAVFGVISGSWSAELAARIPEGARVLIATDQDVKAGEKYAREIAASLRGRCELRRWRAAGDVNEVGLAAGRIEEVA